MLRQIINIDDDKCNGCCLCARAYHGGAIEIINGLKIQYAYQVQEG